MIAPGKVVSLLELLRAHVKIYANCCSIIGMAMTTFSSSAPFNSNEFNLILIMLDTELKSLRIEAEKAGLGVTVKQIDRVLYILGNELLVSPSAVHPPLMEVQRRLEDELEQRVFLQVSPQRAAFFDNPRKGWEETIASLSIIADDVEEMSKCFALSRYPACVFHSMQVVEHGVIELGNILRVKDHKPGWVATTQELKRILRKPHEQRSQWEKDHYSFLEQINATVEALMTAWRHKIDHVAGRLAVLPGEVNPDTAEDIMSATRAFMRRLASERPMLVRPDTDVQ
jgi:hypothetical protein